MNNLHINTNSYEPVFVLMSEKWNKHVFDNLASLRTEGVLCDVTLQGNDEKQLLAHSSVLAAASSVLKSCLMQAPRGHYVVKIPSISSSIWELLLCYMYTGQVKATHRDKDELVTATQTLGLTELQSLCNVIHGAKSSEASQVLVTGSSLKGAEGTLGGGEDEIEEPMDTNFRMPAVDESVLAKKTKYTCEKCGKSFPFGRSLMVHEMSHHKETKKEPKYTCSKCDKHFNTYHSLRAHERTHRYLPYKCNVCSAGFHFKVNYELHKRKVHGLGDFELYRCQYCNKDFEALGLLHRHQATVHKIKRDAAEKKQATEAVKQEEEQVGGKCLECELEFESRSELHEHFKNVHRVKRKVSCSECDLVFNSTAALKEHFAEHTGEPYERPFNCSQCSKSFLYKHALVMHEKDAHFEGEQTCQVCSQVLKSSRMLAKHMKLHEGQVNATTWVCTQCDQVFNDRPTYAIHMAEHRGDKIYFCKYCSKAFPHKGNYSTHMQRHLGIKPFSCQYCNKTFVRKDDMRSHMRVHTGEKPFACQVCDVRFASQSNLREHERSKHNVSFSKRNPVTTPRQLRAKTHRGSKTVEQIDITQDGALAELADVVTGVLNTNQGSEIVMEPAASGAGVTEVSSAEGIIPSEPQQLTVIQQPDGTYAQVTTGQGEQDYEKLYFTGDQVYQVVMEAGEEALQQTQEDVKSEAQ